MIKVRIRTPIAGDHGTHPADAVVTFPPHVARQILDTNMGVLVVEDAVEVLDDDQVDGDITPEATAPAAAPGPKGRKKAKPSEPAAPIAPPAKVGLDESEWSTE